MSPTGAAGLAGLLRTGGAARSDETARSTGVADGDASTSEFDADDRVVVVMSGVTR